MYSEDDDTFVGTPSGVARTRRDSHRMNTRDLLVESLRAIDGVVLPRTGRSSLAVDTQLKAVMERFYEMGKASMAIEIARLRADVEHEKSERHAAEQHLGAVRVAAQRVAKSHPDLRELASEIIAPKKSYYP